MAISITHAFTSPLSDGADANQVQPSNWNDDHAFEMATGAFLGRLTGGTGVVEELTLTTAGAAILDDASASDQRTTLGLGNVDNTSDAGKPVSTAQQTALDAKPDNVTLVRRVITSSSTYTPTTGTVSIIGRLTGGGGGGGGADGADASSAAGGAGGQGGGTAIFSMTAAEVGANAAVTIGAGGSAGSSSGGDGGDGGDSTFNPAGTGLTVTGAGGEGGEGEQASDYGSFTLPGYTLGGTTNADTEIRGIAGVAAVIFSSNFASAGAGGPSSLGGSGIGAIRIVAGSEAGLDGQNGGGGGGAASFNTTSGAAGGAGGGGYLEIIELVVT